MTLVTWNIWTVFEWHCISRYSDTFSWINNFISRKNTAAFCSRKVPMWVLQVNCEGYHKWIKRQTWKDLPGPRATKSVWSFLFCPFGYRQRRRAGSTWIFENFITYITTKVLKSVPLLSSLCFMVEFRSFVEKYLSLADMIIEWYELLLGFIQCVDLFKLRMRLRTSVLIISVILLHYSILIYFVKKFGIVCRERQETRLVLDATFFH